MKEKILNNVIFLAPIYILLSILQIPFLNTSAVHHDNTRYFFGSFSELTKSVCWNDTQFFWLLRIGRPLTAIFECWNFKYISTFQDLLNLRFFAFFLLLVVATLLFAYFRSIYFSRFLSALASLLFCIVAPFSYWIFTVNIASFASVICVIATSFIIKLFFLNPSNISQRDVIIIFCLTISSSFLYPINLFLLIPLSLCEYLNTLHLPSSSTKFVSAKKVSRLRNIFPPSFLISIFAIFLSLVISKIISSLIINNLDLLSSIAIPSSYQLDISIPSLIGKLHTNPSIFTRSLLQYHEETFFGKSFSWHFIISLSCFSLVYLRRNKLRPFYNIFSAIILFSSAFYLTHLPIVLSKIPSLFFRTSLPAQWLFCLLLFFNFFVFVDLFSHKRFGQKYLAFFFFIPILTAHYLILFSLNYTSVSLAQKEYDFISKAIDSANSVPWIIEITTPRFRNLAGIPPIADEYYATTFSIANDGQMIAAIQSVISTKTKFKDYNFKASHVGLCNSNYPCTDTADQAEIGQISVRRIEYDSSNTDNLKHSQCHHSGSLFIDLASYVESTSANIENINSIDISPFVFNCDKTL